MIFPKIPVLTIDRYLVLKLDKTYYKYKPTQV